ncbi:MAG TPA: hypothetical protein V6C52_15290 [Coleofasciculaceae cyanobacterium]|jgi:hypothetical protein
MKHIAIEPRLIKIILIVNAVFLLSSALHLLLLSPPFAYDGPAIAVDSISSSIWVVGKVLIPVCNAYAGLILLLDYKQITSYGFKKPYIMLGIIVVIISLWITLPTFFPLLTWILAGLYCWATGCFFT